MRIEDYSFSESELMHTSIVKKLQANNFIYIDDLSTINYWELFKIRCFGILKVYLVQQVMKDEEIFFADKTWMPSRLSSQLKKSIIDKHRKEKL